MGQNKKQKKKNKKQTNKQTKKTQIETEARKDQMPHECPIRLLSTENYGNGRELMNQTDFSKL